jgi:hypothetical protein
MRVRPYADSTWLTNFPRYTAGMKKELEGYEFEVKSAKEELSKTELPGSRRTAQIYEKAGKKFFALAVTGEIDGDMLTRYNCRIALDRAEAASPSVDYILPPEDSISYQYIAPFPERGFNSLPSAHVQVAQTATTSAASSSPSTGMGRGLRGRGRPRGRPRGSRGRAKGGVLGAG